MKKMAMKLKLIIPRLESPIINETIGHCMNPLNQQLQTLKLMGITNSYIFSNVRWEATVQT